MDLKDSKLIVLLKSLNKEEFEKLEAYIHSPFFNTSIQIRTLFEIFKKQYPGFNLLDKKAIYKKIYPGGQYKDKKIRDLFSRMLKLTEEFLAQMEFMKRKILVKRYTLRQLADKNLEKHFINKSKEAELSLSKEKIINTNHFFDKYSISKEKRSYLEILKVLGKRSVISGDITKEIDLFIIYTIYNILKYALTLQTHEKVFRHKYDFRMLDEVLTFIKKQPLNDYPVIMIMYYIIILNREEGNDKSYFEAKKLLDEHLDTLEEEDQRIILVFLTNYAQTQAIKGDEEFKKEHYKLLKETTDKGLHPMQGNYFAENSYITIAGTALQKKDFAWAEQFMNKYKDKLPPEQRDNAYNYCMSTLNYRKGNYKKALEGLAKVSIDDFYYHLRVKNHEIKIFFELGDYEKVLFTVDSFRHFLGSNKFIPDYLRDRFLSYANFTSRIANAMLTNNAAEKIIPIRRELDQHDANMENRTWLLEQIDKLQEAKLKKL